MTKEQQQAMNDRSRRFAVLMNARKAQYPHESYHDRFMRCSRSPEGAAIWEEAERAKHTTPNAMMAANSYDASQPRDPAGTSTGGQWTSGGGAERKMFMASRGKYETAPPVPFYAASTEEYARNYGDNLIEVTVAPNKILDLTKVAADADDGAHQLKALLEHHGVDTKGIQFLRDDELAQSLNRNLPELSKRIHAAGFDAAELNEYVYGGGSDTTMLVVSDKAVRGTKRVE